MFYGSTVGQHICARIHWRYDGKCGVYEDPDGHGTLFVNEDGALEDFWWTDGNGACDCNRSRLFGIGELPCGETIEILKIEPLLAEKESRAMTESEHG